MSKGGNVNIGGSMDKMEVDNMDKVDKVEVNKMDKMDKM